MRKWPRAHSGKRRSRERRVDLLLAGDEFKVVEVEQKAVLSLVNSLGLVEMITLPSIRGSS
jgi:hypothetical protein